MIDVDDEQDVRQRLHILDTAEAALEFFLLAVETEDFFLREALESAFLGHGFQHHQAFDRLTDGLVVRQHASEPAIADKRHPGASRMIADRIAGCAFGANEQHLAAIGDRCLDECAGLASQWKALLEVDDMDLVALAEDVGSHLRVPEAGLVTKMHASL